jgi:hypothetical protein
MDQRFFQLSDDVHLPHRWHLKSPADSQGCELDNLFGQYKSVRGLRIDKQRVGNARVFRPEGWDVDLIVSHEIKEALERLGATGVRFEEV